MMLPPGRPGGFRGFRSFGRSWAEPAKVKWYPLFWGQAMIIYRAFCSSSIMVQPKLKEKDWKRNHHCVKVRYLDVFWHISISIYLVCLYVASYTGPFGPQIHLQLGLVACCPGKQLKLHHPCNRTWEPWHFTSKKKGGSRMGFFHYKNGRAGISTSFKKVTMKVVYKEDRWSEERSLKPQEGG